MVVIVGMRHTVKQEVLLLLVAVVPLITEYGLTALHKLRGLSRGC